jgi:hypothetical protein
MRLALASDHAGFSLKQGLLEWLKDSEHQLIDLGTYSKGALIAAFWCVGAEWERRSPPINFPAFVPACVTILTPLTKALSTMI